MVVVGKLFSWQRLYFMESSSKLMALIPRNASAWKRAVKPIIEAVPATYAWLLHSSLASWLLEIILMYLRTPGTTNGEQPHIFTSFIWIYLVIRLFCAHHDRWKEAQTSVMNRAAFSLCRGGSTYVGCADVRTYTTALVHPLQTRLCRL